MNAFTTALGDILADENVGVDADYRPGGAGEPVRVRAAMSAPDVATDIGGALIRAGDWQVCVAAADIATPRRNDTIEIEGNRFVVLSAAADSERLSWTMILRPLE